MSEPLDITLNLDDTKTAIPAIADNTMVSLRLANLTQVKTEKGNSLRWEYDLVEPANDTDGGKINPGDFGSKIFEHIALYSRPDAKDPDWFKKRIASRIDALLGTGDRGNPKGKPERPALSAKLVPELIGKTLVAKMRVRKDDFGGNEIASVTFPGDIAS
jgi:hypothetical protein